VLFYIFYGRCAIPSGVIANRFGYTAVVTYYQRSGRTAYAGARHAQDQG
jgi:hypothetical protein